jgi:hypothetical protein
MSNADPVRSNPTECECCGQKFIEEDGVRYSLEQLRIKDLISDRRELRARVKDLERNCQILMRSACPEGSWCAPNELPEDVIDAVMPKAFIGNPEARQAAKDLFFKHHRESIIERWTIQRQAYLASRGKA